MTNPISLQELKVDLKGADYIIQIAPSLLTQPIPYLENFTGSKVLIVSNPVVAPLYLEEVENNFISQNINKESIFSFLIDDGEVNKSKESYFLLLDFLIENNFRRNDLIVALGGGVIGDLTGFVAASFQRGMELIQIPTTLLSQVDSSVGGKTAINHRLGKNLIGAFYQPKQVIIDTNTLLSLPDREFVSGLAEVAKYAFLGDDNIHQLLSEQSEAILDRDMEVLAQITFLSCKMKASIVAQDEKEMGKRAVLNLGHSFAHALETLTDYSHYLHGEAVAIGIIMAFDLSVKKSFLSRSSLESAKQLLKKLNLPVKSELPFDTTKFLSIMAKDKKNKTDSLRLVLLNEDGPIIVEEDDRALIASVIAEYTA